MKTTKTVLVLALMLAGQPAFAEGKCHAFVRRAITAPVMVPYILWNNAHWHEDLQCWWHPDLSETAPAAEVSGTRTNIPISEFGSGIPLRKTANGRHKRGFPVYHSSHGWTTWSDGTKSWVEVDTSDRAVGVQPECIKYRAEHENGEK